VQPGKAAPGLVCTKHELLDDIDGPFDRSAFTKMNSRVGFWQGREAAARRTNPVTAAPSHRAAGIAPIADSRAHENACQKGSDTYTAASGVGQLTWRQCRRTNGRTQSRGWTGLGHPDRGMAITRFLGLGQLEIAEAIVLSDAARTTSAADVIARFPHSAGKS
jgi:hypothetical protein